MPSSIIIRQAVIDFICLATVWLPVLLLDLIGTPYQRGFFCDDESIRHPYHDNTVTTPTLYAFGLVIPIGMMTIVEICRARFSSSKINGLVVNGEIPRRTSVPLFGHVRVPFVVLEVTHMVAMFLFGAGCSQIATDIAKYSIGRLRPHFIDVCKPDWSKIDCSNHNYVEEPFCLTENNPEYPGYEYKLKDARLSFPSGHASFSAYTMFYTALYLQGRMKWSGSKLLRPLLQLTVIMLAWFTGLSRVSDYKHHWSDVLTGLLIGTIAASLTALYITKLFALKWLRNSELIALNPRDHADETAANLSTNSMHTVNQSA